MNIDDHICKLSGYVERRNYSGYDPYDALNSPIAVFFSLGLKYGRIAWTQLLRRLPINLRPLLLIRKGHNPKGVGLFLGGYSKLYRKSANPEYLEIIDHLLELLDKLKSTGYSGNCWGYNFDWQSRAFFVPRLTPTIVNTAFIGHALLDAYEATGNEKALETALPICSFLINDLNRTYEGDSFCFSYSPIDKLVVHNANLMGASILIRLYQITGDDETREVALSSLAYSMNHQRGDGSWFYADTKMQNWIDSFHTGFNLQAIRYFLSLGEAQEYRSKYDKGVAFYADHFFLDDGTPKYYNNSIYPIDIHSPAQAIVFFSGEGQKYQVLTDRILTWTMDNLYDARGFFYFRKGRFITNRIPYMRWSQAWAFHALTEYQLNQQTPI